MLRIRIPIAVLIVGLTGWSFGQSEDPSAAEERAEADRAVDPALEQLFEEQPDAKRLYEQCYGYAVFTNYKFAAGIVAGGGNGVAIKKETDDRYYMDMGTAGIAAGLGGQKYQLVLLFETEDTFNDFITDGWEATASANAVAGEAGANVATSFKDGVLVYPMTDAGLMLNLDISGTRFWIDEEVNQTAMAGSNEQFFRGDEPESRDQIDPIEPGDEDYLDNSDVLEHERNVGIDESIEQMPQQP